MIEVVPSDRIDTEIVVPGSKYASNRALICAALAKGTSILHHVPSNEDILGAIDALRKFGVRIEWKEDALIIQGIGGSPKTPSSEIDVGNSGTLLRFITAFCALCEGKTRITGSKRIQERPVDDLLLSLKELGITSSSSNGCAPLTITGGSLRGGKSVIDGSKSSQFISALLLCAPYASKAVEITVRGGLVSRGYVDMTIEIMKQFGVFVKREGYGRFIVPSGQRYAAQDLSMPSDASSANYFLAAGALTAGKVRVKNISSHDPESGFITILEKMGCRIIRGKDFAEVLGPKKLRAVDVDMGTLPDSVQTLAVLACFAAGTTKIRGISHLAHKESDRVKDTVTEIGKLRIEASCTRDEMAITGGNAHGAVIDPHGDHRMAMSFALAGLKVPGIKILHPECAGKSFPGFWDSLQGLGVGIKRAGNGNIILIGYRGAGKTSTAKEIAKRSNSKFISTDAEIEKQVGPIAKYVKSKGWDSFRDAEEKVIGDIKGDSLVVDCGGGVIEREKNVDSLKKIGTLVWLRASPDQIRKRIGRDKGRPSLTGKKSFLDEIEDVLRRREPLYRKAADLIVDTDNKTPSEIADEIAGLSGIIGKNALSSKKSGTLLCVPITASTEKQAIADIKQAEKIADAIELRVDFLQRPTKALIKKLLSVATKETIVTCRSPEDNGRFRGSDEEKASLLIEALKRKGCWVDVEHDFPKRREVMKSKREGKIILSYHNFKGTLPLKELENIYHRLERDIGAHSGPDMVKMVTTANSILDNFTIFSLLLGKIDLCAFCMGVKGVISRILAAKYGSLLTFGSLSIGKESAPGQLTASEMNDVFGIGRIRPSTQVFGVIGNLAEHSKSKYMHNAGFRASGLDGVYVPFKVESDGKKDELRKFMLQFRKFRFSGASVTVPHKESIRDLLDSVDETASSIGAVNTIVLKDGKLLGSNTDHLGAVFALKERTTLRGKKALLIGSGGAAKAILYGLTLEGALVTVINRTPKKAQDLAKEFGARAVGMEEGTRIAREQDIIINATSVGMSPKDKEIPFNGPFRKGQVVMDIVYTPKKTQFIKRGKSSGCITITGERMLLGQALTQYRLFTGSEPSMKLMEKELLSHMEKG